MNTFLIEIEDHFISGLLLFMTVVSIVSIPVGTHILNRKITRRGKAGKIQQRSKEINSFALVALITVFAAPGIAPILFGRAAIREIKYSKEKGKTLAYIATVLGYVFVSVLPLVLIYQIFISPMIEPTTQEKIAWLTDKLLQYQGTIDDNDITNIIPIDKTPHVNIPPTPYVTETLTPKLP